MVGIISLALVYIIVFFKMLEMVMPIGSNGVTDFFPPQPWDLKAYIEGCQKTLKVTPRPYWAAMYYGGRELQAASNIVFSNGTHANLLF